MLAELELLGEHGRPGIEVAALLETLHKSRPVSRGKMAAVQQTSLPSRGGG